MTAADIGRFILIVGLGALSFITFLFAGTIVVLMAVLSSGCNCFTYFPVGLAVLGLLGLIFLIDMIIDITSAPSILQAWYKGDERHKQRLILLAISVAAIYFVTSG